MLPQKRNSETTSIDDAVALLDLHELTHADQLRKQPGPERVRDWLESAGRRGGGDGLPVPPTGNDALVSSANLTADEPEEIEPPSLTVALGGRSSKLKIPQGRVFKGGGTRKKINEFSKASRRALLHTVESIDQHAQPSNWWRFVTLTYPEGYPSAAASKRHLFTFLKRFRREFGPRGMIWKLEAQPKRGAPHFHLLILLGPPYNVEAEVEWFAHAWHEIAGAGDRNHLRVHLGQARNRPCLEVMNSYQQGAIYAGKYLGKLPEDGETWDEPGRFWGVFGRELLPVRRARVNVDEDTAIVAKRTFRRYLQHQPTGRYRIERNGIVARRKLKRAEVAQLLDAGYSVRPYHRRRHRSKVCGVQLLGLPAYDSLRILQHAQDTCEARIPFG